MVEAVFGIRSGNFLKLVKAIKAIVSKAKDELKGKERRKLRVKLKDQT